MSLDARYWDREFETRPWAWIEAWQAQQLAMMLETLPQRSELYRETLAAAGSRVGLRGYWVSRGRLPTLDMLETVPFTTAPQLRDAQEHAPPGRPLGPQQAVPQQYIVQVVASQTNDGAARPVFSGLTRRDQEVWSDAIANTLGRPASARTTWSRTSPTCPPSPPAGHTPTACGGSAPPSPGWAAWPLSRCWPSWPRSR